MLKISWRIVDGTVGRGVPWEESQRMVVLEFGMGNCSSWSEVLVDDRCCISWSQSWAAVIASSSMAASIRVYTLYERASATGLASPLMCRISLVNSEMKAKCHACWGDSHSELDWRAKVRGLESVLMLKGHPSTKYWK